MNLILILALLQVPPAEPPIEAFLKGNEGARVELLKLGPRVLPSLLRARDSKPEAIDALHEELRKAAAYPAPVSWAPPFDGGTMGLGLKVDTLTSFDAFLGAFNHKGIPLCSDLFDGAKLIAAEIRVENAKGPQDLIEQLCRETGLDYGWFHGFVVVGTPERLWACREPAKAPDLDAASRAKAAEMIEKLGHESVEVREAATRELAQLGRAVIPILEAKENRKDPDIAARCDAIVIQLRAPAQGVFGPAACLRQELSPRDRGLLDHMRLAKPELSFDKMPLSEIAAQLKKYHSVECVIPEAHLGVKVTIQTTGQSLLDMLSMITQVRDLDFLVQDRKVVVETRDAIEKKLKESK